MLAKLLCCFGGGRCALRISFFCVSNFLYLFYFRISSSSKLSFISRLAVHEALPFDVHLSSLSCSSSILSQTEYSQWCLRHKCASSIAQAPRTRSLLLTFSGNGAVRQHTGRCLEHTVLVCLIWRGVAVGDELSIAW